jgi:uncharacterized protein YabE (DUF348 family)
MLAVVLLALVGQATADYVRGLTPVIVVEDGRVRRARTQCSTVGQLLDDLGTVIGPQDDVSHGEDEPLSARMRIEVAHARPVRLVVDGESMVVYTHAQSAEEVLSEAGIVLRPWDRLRVDGEWRPTPDVAESSDVGMRAASVGAPRAALAFQPVSRIEVVHATQVQLVDGDATRTLHSTARSVGEALAEADVLLYEGDVVVPDLDAPLMDGLEVQVYRAKPVEVLVDGGVLRVRTQSERVGEVLAEMGVSLVGLDYCDPDLDARVAAGSQVRVTRVAERLVVEQEELPFETLWVPDNTLELDQRHLDDPGAKGVRRRRFREVYHDQALVERVLEEDWLAQAPRPRQIAYGTRVVVRTLETPYGTIEYWRRIHVFRTAYTAATCGKTPDHPLYGITRLGWKMRFGIVATDPRVIPLRTELYVPGYGPGVAGDTGGLIIGRHVDLGFEENGLVWHHEWGYVYLLTPVPPADDIPYILPDYPMGVYK